jgi:hypothetical protein
MESKSNPLNLELCAPEAEELGTQNIPEVGSAVLLLRGSARTKQERHAAACKV